MENVTSDQNERTELSWGKCAKGKGLITQEQTVEWEEQKMRQQRKHRKR